MHRNTDDRHRENSGTHTGQMGCHTSSGDDYLEAFFLRTFCILKKYIRLSVSADHGHLIRDAQFFQNVCCLRHHRHIGITTHYNANLRAILCICHNVLLMYRLYRCLSIYFYLTKILSMMQWFYKILCFRKVPATVRSVLPYPAGRISHFL